MWDNQGLWRTQHFDQYATFSIIHIIINALNIIIDAMNIIINATNIIIDAKNIIIDIKFTKIL